MKLLGIDTSTKNISIAGVSGEKIIFHYKISRERGASLLVNILKKNLILSSVKLRDFDCFVIGAGPGSFTGLRISFSVVKAFSLSLKKPVISLSSFYSVAYQLKDKAEKIAVFSDARRDLVYGALFHIRKDKIIKKRKESLWKLENFVDSFDEYLFVTYDAHLREKLKSLNRKVNIYPKDCWPDAFTLCRIAKHYFLKNKFTSLDKLEPLYVYPKECQIRTKS